MSDAEVRALERAAKDDPEARRRLGALMDRLGAGFSESALALIQKANGRLRRRAIPVPVVRRVIRDVVAEGRVWGLADGPETEHGRRDPVAQALVVVDGDSVTLAIMPPSGRYRGFKDRVRGFVPGGWITDVIDMGPRDHEPGAVRSWIGHPSCFMLAGPPDSRRAELHGEPAERLARIDDGFRRWAREEKTWRTKGLSRAASRLWRVRGSVEDALMFGRRLERLRGGRSG